jgi:poly-gamma-glutamate synthesis protein (capsule biosynthesis protein)
LSGDGAAEVAEGVWAVKRAGDVVVASVQLGSNWGFDVFRDQVRFANRP